MQGPDLKITAKIELWSECLIFGAIVLLLIDVVLVSVTHEWDSVGYLVVFADLLVVAASLFVKTGVKFAMSVVIVLVNIRFLPWLFLSCLLIIGSLQYVPSEPGENALHLGGLLRLTGYKMFVAALIPYLYFMRMSILYNRAVSTTATAAQTQIK